MAKETLERQEIKDYPFFPKEGGLETLLLNISIEAFNELILVYYNLDEYAGWRKRALFATKTGLTDSLGSDRFGLNANGYNMANFPWDELEKYCWALDRHLTQDLIIPINWEEETELGIKGWK